MQIEKFVKTHLAILITIAIMLMAGIFFPADFLYAATAIQGKVTDKATTKPIASASVKISIASGATAASAATDSTGSYLITKNLATGSYIILVSASNYKSYTLVKVIYQGRTHILNFALEPTAKNNPPQVISFTPNNDSRSVMPFFIGDTINISVSATDKDKDKLYYRYSMDGQILQSWTLSSSYSFKLTGLAGHKLKIEVTDNKGGLDSRTTDIYALIASPAPPAG